MNRSILLMSAIVGVVGLSACERETVVGTPTQPPTTVITTPAPDPAPNTNTTTTVPVPVPVPGPQGPKGEPGKPGEPGTPGPSGRPGDSTVIVVPPASEPSR